MTTDKTHSSAPHTKRGVRATSPSPAKGKAPPRHPAPPPFDLKKGVAARRVALRGLMRVARRRASVPVSLQKGGLGRLSTQEAALCWHLVHTALRHAGPLLGVLEKHERKQALAGQPHGVALWLAMADWLLLDSAPHAVADLWVEASKNVGTEKAAGAVNAALRRLLQTKPLLEMDRVHPLELNDALARFGPELETLLRQGLHTHTRLALWPLDNPAWMDQGFTPEGWPAVLHIAPEKLGDAEGALKRALAGGQALLLDPGSAFLALNLPVGKSLLDLCAGAGVKSRLVRERPHPPPGHVLLSPEKVLRMDHWRFSPQRKNVRLYMEKLPPEESFDTVWVDAPCSGSGTLGRNPEAALRLSTPALKKHAALQLKLLLSALPHLKAGGALVYITCSLHEEENEQVIRALKQLRPDLKQQSLANLEGLWPFTLKPMREGTYVFPQQPGGDCFFVSVLRSPPRSKGASSHGGADTKRPKGPPARR